MKDSGDNPMSGLTLRSALGTEKNFQFRNLYNAMTYMQLIEKYSKLVSIFRFHTTRTYF